MNNSQNLIQQLTLNIVPFIPPIQSGIFPFYKDKKHQPGFCPISAGDLEGVLEQKFSRLEALETEWLYTDFGEPKPDAIMLEIDFTQNIYFAAHYYRHLLRTHFKGIADIMHQNFTNEVEVWFHNTSLTSSKYNVYNQYTLKIQHNKVSNGPELLISYDGRTKVYKKSVAEMVGFPTHNFNWMNCYGTLCRYKFLSDEHKRNLDKIFPVLSNKLKPQLSIAFDVPDTRNRYPVYKKALQEFYELYINTDTFKSLFPGVENGFYSLPENDIKQIPGDSNLLEYGGEKKGTQPKFDLRDFGPFKPVPMPNNVRFFFIYQASDKQTHVKTIWNYFTKGYKGFPDMGRFIHQPFSLDDNHAHIEFESIDTAFDTVKKAMSDKVKLPETRYCAIYISPVSKFETDPVKKRVYYQIKELLLYEGIASQVIFRENVSKEAFNYFLPNIEVAILAKLGGVPWRLKRDTSHELIVGIGAFYSTTTKSRYVGSAFCFNNEGIFKGFDCFGGTDIKSLAASIREAVEIFLETNHTADRLIIHFYKDMSKRELKPIMNMLHTLGLNIPVFIVTINKTASKELLGFDNANNNLMPFSGTFLQVGRNEFLLFNNTRYDAASKPTAREYHFPVKLKISGTNPELLEDENLVNLLIDQVYQFSRMYWKSVSQQNLPVTIKYPEMVAEIYPHFTHSNLADYGRENLWFL